LEYLISFFEIAARVVDVFGLALLVVCFVRGAVGWLRLEWQRLPWEERLMPLRKLRCVVGLHILFALELMIVSDIIESFLAVARYEADDGNFFSSTAFYSLVQLAMIVAIRTVIEHFLSKEIESIHD
jgi:uncharacterized membrane protein